MTASLTYRLGTVLFWVALLALWIAAPGGRGEAPEATEVTAASAAPAEVTFSLDEVARHALADDCWMVIDDTVYDITAYVERHPAEPEVLLSWCGREATQAYRTKLRDRPHSARADGLLARYRVGSLHEAVLRRP